jgi:integrase
MSKRLSKDDEAVRDIAPPMKNKLVVPDQAVKKLLLIVHRTGSKTWALRRYPKPGVPSTESIGMWPDMTVDEARKRALLDEGPGKTTGNAKTALAADTVAAVAKDFIVRYVEKEKLRSQPEIERVFAKYILPQWADRPLSEIKRDDVTKLLDHIEDAHGPRMADVALAYLRQLMGWYAVRKGDYNSPIIQKMNRSKRIKRSHVLSDDAIRALWKAAPQLGSFGAMCQVLLLTGQRLAKVATMQREHVEDGIWTIHAEGREKGNGGTLVLPPMVQAIIAAQPEIIGRPFVFACGGYQIEHKARLDKLMRAELGGDLPEWRIHDLRRTARTRMAEAGVPSDHAEAVMGHSLPGLVGTYNRHGYVAEKAQALAKLAALVGRIVRQGPGVAVGAPGRRRAPG